MSYDLMNRRDNVTQHHTSVAGAEDAIKNYLDIGAPPEKINRKLLAFSRVTSLLTPVCSRLRVLRQIFHDRRRLWVGSSWLSHRTCRR